MDNDVTHGKTSPRERLHFYKNKKLQKRRQQTLASYHKNKTIKQIENKQTPSAIKNHLYRTKQAEMRPKKHKKKEM